MTSFGQTLEQAAQGSCGVTIRGGFKKMCRCGTFGMWFSRQGGFGVTVGLDDLRGLFQPMNL